MKKIFIFLTSLCSSFLYAPDIEFDSQDLLPNESLTKIDPKFLMRPKIAPHEPIKELSNRSSFEQAIKTRDLDHARLLFNHAKESDVTTEEFVKHLHDRYNNTHGKITDLYSGKKTEEAREQLMQDLLTINPHLAKTFRDSFKVKDNAPSFHERNDNEYFQHLDQYHDQITNPTKINEPTPFEIAVLTGSKEMAQKIIELAKKHKISASTLIDPLMNEYKKIMKTKGQIAAQEFVKKVYDLKIQRISEVFYNNIKDINFEPIHWA